MSLGELSQEEMAQVSARIIVLGEFDADFEPHIATNAAIAHVNAKCGLGIDFEWVSTETVDAGLVKQCDGLWVAPGSPYKNLGNTLAAIRHARENGIPMLGTCGGFQHMILELARNVLGIKDAAHAEYDPYASLLFVSQLECSLAGREMEIVFKSGSKVAQAYGSSRATETYYCNFGMNPAYVEKLRYAVVVVGSDSEGEVRIIELPGHPFYVGTLFVPQARSSAEKPHPLVAQFLMAAKERSGDK